MAGNWEIRANGDGYWREDTQTFTVDGTTYTITKVVLRPEWFQRIQLVSQTRDTATFRIDTDST